MRKQSKWSLPGVLIFVLAAGTVVHAADSRPGIQKISAPLVWIPIILFLVV